jgi:hypothetical protein
MAELIVGGALLRIGQGFVGRLGLLEFFFGLLVVRIAVRVMLHRQPAIGLLDLVFGGVARHSKGFVQVFLGHGLKNGKRETGNGKRTKNGCGINPTTGRQKRETGNGKRAKNRRGIGPTTGGRKRETGNGKRSEYGKGTALCPRYPVPATRKRLGNVHHFFALDFNDAESASSSALTRSMRSSSLC